MLGLIIVAIIATLGGIGLIAANKTLPDGLIALGSASVGALSTLLVAPRGDH